MPKLTKKPKRPAFGRAKTAFAVTSMVIAVGCGDDDAGADAGISVGVVAPDSGPDVPNDSGELDAGNDSAPPPGLMAPDAD